MGKRHRACLARVSSLHLDPRHGLMDLSGVEGLSGPRGVKCRRCPGSWWSSPSFCPSTSTCWCPMLWPGRCFIHIFHVDSEVDSRPALPSAPLPCPESRWAKVCAGDAHYVPKSILFDYKLLSWRACCSFTPPCCGPKSGGTDGTFPFRRTRARARGGVGAVLRGSGRMRIPGGRPRSARPPIFTWPSCIRTPRRPVVEEAGPRLNQRGERAWGLTGLNGLNRV